jgi:tetratricopeptide (TPR) repeat protein
LQKGATCTLGAVDEPYLGGTPDIFTFLSRFMAFGFTFGEAAYAAQASTSWQTTCIGDPLYRPFGKNLDSLHRQFQQQASPMLEWSHLLLANRNLASGAPVSSALNYLEPLPLVRESAVLTEKIGDLYWSQNKFTDALETWEAALRRKPSPQQKIRLLLTLAEKRSLVGPDAKAFDLYQRFLKDYPDYPDMVMVYQGLLPVAKRMGKKDVVEKCEAEIKRLSPSPAATGGAPKS